MAKSKLFNILVFCKKTIAAILNLLKHDLKKKLYQRAFMRKVTQLSEKLTYLKAHEHQSAAIITELEELNAKELITQFIALRNKLLYKYPMNTI